MMLIGISKHDVMFPMVVMNYIPSTWYLMLILYSVGVALYTSLIILLILGVCLRMYDMSQPYTSFLYHVAMVNIPRVTLCMAVLFRCHVFSSLIFHYIQKHIISLLCSLQPQTQTLLLYCLKKKAIEVVLVNAF